MKKMSLLCLAVLMFFVGVPNSNAALIDRGGGLIYDSDLDVTWLQDANYAQTSGYSSTGAMTWAAAMAWADQLEFAGFTEWRLPELLPVDGSSSYNFNWSRNGSTDQGYNISAPGSVYEGSTASEMAYLYYNSLGKLGAFDVTGAANAVYGVDPADPFYNVMTSRLYWSNADISSATSAVFLFSNGRQILEQPSTNSYFAWAVHDGDIGAPVPISGTLLLFASGIVGLVGIGRKNRK